ncbi:MAG: (2Fe-2S) ferredoxin domain-containing protein, partial [Thermoanaerobacteraceae bacterium]|nr:(2Fe-2S) ferredoxin domain-containing protein [Thermoanaerobacteraceae bacterium]
MYEIRVGLGSCGIASGGLDVYDEILKETEGMDVKLYPTGCVGMCYKEPLVDIIDEEGRVVTYGSVKPNMIKEIVKSHVVEG